MNPAVSNAHPSWFARVEMWLDARGRGAWIAAMIFGFVFFWPAGLAILAYMIWTNRMPSKANTSQPYHTRAPRYAESTGNTAFDAYKSDMLKRLEDEQHAFESFLARLRQAKDKSEFDAFMDERAKAATSPSDDHKVAS